MIKFENTVTPSPDQWKSAVMGARNAMNSWDRSDSTIECVDYDSVNERDVYEYKLGPNDCNLLKRLRNTGTADHRKYMRMLPVMVDITAPLYLWKEADQYKVGTTTNSCSTMHTIHKKEFDISDFSCEHLPTHETDRVREDGSVQHNSSAYKTLEYVIHHLNIARDMYLKTKDKKYWWQMIQLLPSSYNQKRTVMLNYEVLANIYKSRKNHKLNEWHDFCDWIESLPYSELITGENK